MICCKNFGRFHRRNFKKITNKTIKKQANTFVWACIIPKPIILTEMIVAAVTKKWDGDMGLGTRGLGDSGTWDSGMQDSGTPGCWDSGTGDAGLENAGTRGRGAYRPQGSDKQTKPDFFFAEFVMYNFWCSNVRFYMLESLSAD